MIIDVNLVDSTSMEGRSLVQRLESNSVVVFN